MRVTDANTDASTVSAANDPHPVNMDAAASAHQGSIPTTDQNQNGTNPNTDAQLTGRASAPEAHPPPPSQPQDFANSGNATSSTNTRGNGTTPGLQRSTSTDVNNPAVGNGADPNVSANNQPTAGADNSGNGQSNAVTDANTDASTVSAANDPHPVNMDAAASAHQGSIPTTDQNQNGTNPEEIHAEEIAASTSETGHGQHINGTVVIHSPSETDQDRQSNLEALREHFRRRSEDGTLTNPSANNQSNADAQSNSANTDASAPTTPDASAVAPVRSPGTHPPAAHANSQALANSSGSSSVPSPQAASPPHTSLRGDAGEFTPAGNRSARPQSAANDLHLVNMDAAASAQATEPLALSPDHSSVTSRQAADVAARTGSSLNGHPGSFLMPTEAGQALGVSAQRPADPDHQVAVPVPATAATSASAHVRPLRPIWPPTPRSTAPRRRQRQYPHQNLPNQQQQSFQHLHHDAWHAQQNMPYTLPYQPSQHPLNQQHLGYRPQMGYLQQAQQLQPTNLPQQIRPTNLPQQQPEQAPLIRYDYGQVTPEQAAYVVDQHKSSLSPGAKEWTPRGKHAGGALSPARTQAQDGFLQKAERQAEELASSIAALGSSAPKYKSHIVVAHGNDSPVVVRFARGLDQQPMNDAWKTQKTLTIILRLDDAQCFELDSKRV